MIYINVTNSFTNRLHTGIQRVAKQLSKRLNADDDVTLIVYYGDSFCSLEKDEVDTYLRSEPLAPARRLDVSAFSKGDLFFDIDASWGDPYSSDLLYNALKRRGVIIVKMHYDAVPILFPQYCHDNNVFRFAEDFSSALRYADHFICISSVVRDDLHAISADMGLGRPTASVIDLGSDIPIHSSQRALRAEWNHVLDRKFILAVGTVEPRKNYDLVLDVFEALCNSGASPRADLVIVGRNGWNNAHVVERIRNNPHFNKNLHWFESASDQELNLLYTRARVCLALSHYEGFGLPVVEALSQGTPVICTADSAMEEVGKGFATSVPPDTTSVLQAIQTFLVSDEAPRIPGYRPASWDDSASQVRNVLRSILDTSAFASLPGQAVYISVRPDTLLKSIRSIALHMSFVKAIVVLTSDAQYTATQALLNDIPFTLTLISESELGLNSLPEDHQQRNVALRSALYRSDFIDENFIAMDDDCVVIRPVEIGDFVDRGRHKAYFFYEDGKNWLGALPSPFSFDMGLWRTSAFLAASGYDVRLYNSHQPQVINKRLAAQIFDRVLDLNLDEWSSYFNIAKHLKSAQFADSVYQAAGWPADFDSWLPSHAPNRTSFFNDYGTQRPEGGEIEAAEAWLASLKARLVQASRITPAVPSLLISNEKAAFTEPAIHCSSDFTLCMPILSTEPLTRLRYLFLQHDLSYKEPNIPNFIHVPIGVSNLPPTMEVKVEVSLKNTSQMQTAILKVHLDQ